MGRGFEVRSSIGRRSAEDRSDRIKLRSLIVLGFLVDSETFVSTERNVAAASCEGTYTILPLFCPWGMGRVRSLLSCMQAAVGARARAHEAHDVALI